MLGFVPIMIATIIFNTGSARRNSPIPCCFCGMHALLHSPASLRQCADGSVACVQCTLRCPLSSLSR